MSQPETESPFDAVLAQHERMARATAAVPVAAASQGAESELRWGDVGTSGRGIWRSRCRDCGDPMCQGECLPERTWPCKRCGVEQVSIPDTACLPCVATLHRQDGRIVYGT